MEERWFGTNWGAAICYEEEQIPVPVGKLCLHCKEVIGPDDNGFEQRGMTSQGVRSEYIHRECRIRIVVGSASHLQRTCSCYGGKGHDPPELSVHEAAKLAEKVWMEQKHLSDFECSPLDLARDVPNKRVQ